MIKDFSIAEQKQIYDVIVILMNKLNKEGQ